jgi:CRISPR-associated protein Cmr3
MLGEMNGGRFDKKTIEDLKAIQISGPLPLIRGQVYLPAPKDILVKDEGSLRQAYSIRPVCMRDGEGCDLPEGVLPAMLPESVQEDFKPAKVPAFWSVEMMIRWLANPKGKSFDSPPDPEKIRGLDGFLNLPAKDARTHVRIDPSSGASDEGMLFETVGLDLSLRGETDGIQMAARVESEKELYDQVTKIDRFHTLGGERRLAYWIIEESQKGWSCPDEVAKALAGKQRIRMVLATPAVFSDGWRPGWLNGWPKGKAPCYWPNGLRLKLVSACTDRWKPISGWSLEKVSRGPKAIRRLVPAGSVYFFEVLSGDAGDLAKNLWLRSVSDEDQDRRDGFGLAVWGLWDFADEETTKSGKKEV